MRKLAPLILRIGMTFVMFWFGAHQLGNPAAWTSYLPTWITGLPISAVALVLINGWIECALGVLLLAGFYTRPVALLLSIHLYGIVATVGFDSVGVRDFGLGTALLALSFFGEDDYSLDAFFSKKLVTQG